MRIITSTRAGLGKSLYIKQFSEELEKKTHSGHHCATVPIHGPKVTPNKVVEALRRSALEKKMRAIIFHIDIAQSVSDMVLGAIIGFINRLT